MSVTVQILGSPDWLHPDLGGRPVEQRQWTMPRNDAERAAFERFTAGMAQRLRGSVKRYEVWNEPDLPQFSGGAPSPETYARALAAAYRGLKEQDPEAIVVSGGLSRAAVGFAERMLTALDREPGAAQHNGYVDEVGIHPYADADSPDRIDPRKVFHGQFGLNDHNFSGYRRIASLLDSRGRSSTRIWLGELGYSTTRTWMAPVPEAQRATYLMMAADRAAKDPRVSGIVWFGLTPGSGIGPERSLIDAGGRDTVTFKALSRVNHSTAEVVVPDAPACSVSRLLSGAPETTYPSSCFPTMAGHVRGYELYVDGVKAFQALGSTVTVPRAAVADAGPHRLSVAFYDDMGPVGVTGVGELRSGG